MALPPVKISLSVGGLAEAQSAIKSLAQTLKDLDAQNAAGAKKAGSERASAAKSASQAEREAAKASAQAAKEAAKQIAQSARESANAQKAAAREAAKESAKQKREQDSAVRKAASESKAHARSMQWKAEQKNNAISGGVVGGATAGLVAGGIDLFKGALGAAADALKQFSGFLINDVVKPGLKSNMAAQQLSNKLGGKFNVDQFQGAKNALSRTYAFDQATVEKTLADSIDSTKDFGSGRDMANIALKLGQAFGRDPTKIAAMLGNQKALMPNMSLANFETMATHQMRKINEVGGSKMDEGSLGATGGRVGRMAMQMTARGAGGKANEEAIGYNVVALSGILAKASTMANTADEAADKLDAFMNDMKKNGKKFGLSSDGTTLNRSIGDAIGVVMGKSKGDFSQMMGMGFSESTVKLMEMLTQDGQNLSDVYKNAEKNKAGSGVGAVATLVNSFGKPSGANTADAEASSVRATGWAQITIAMNNFMATMQERLVPVFEKKVIPALMKAEPAIIKMASSLADFVASLAEQDLGKIIVDTVKAVASFGYYLLDFIDKMIPGVNVNESSKKTLYKAAGLGTYSDKEASMGEQIRMEKKLHPEMSDEVAQYTVQVRMGEKNRKAAEAAAHEKKLEGLRTDAINSVEIGNDINKNKIPYLNATESDIGKKDAIANEALIKELTTAIRTNTDSKNGALPGPARSGMPQIARPATG